MRTNMKFLPLLSGILIAVIIAGCNIFSFVSDAEKSPVEKAEEAIRDGDYAKAREALADAVKDSTDSMALYMNAKISLLDRGIDFTKIVDLIEGQDDVQSGDNLAILGTIDEMDDAEKTDWYIANMDVRANLAKIFHNKTTGMLKKDDIALDYTVSNMMSGVFGLRDTNRDGIIDANDFQINLSFISNIGGADTEGFNFDGGEFFDEENPDVPVEFSGFEVFLGEYVPPGTGKISAVHKGKSGY
ncbi:MAG: hypothetical protein HOC71_16585, partial [Candidatus Latescibacteria bacterium]|nr:hypothetical protein [Candidatus Latescibacterota bacterium]